MSLTVERALSLFQPWAHLMALGAKKIETRARPLRFRGFIAIHASKTFQEEHRLKVNNGHHFVEAFAKAGIESADDLPLGMVVGIVEIVDCRPTHAIDLDRFDPERAFGDYTIGRYGYFCRNARLLAKPIPARGMLGLWRLARPITEADLLL